tara:strand:+ start:1747 stop:2352 length:606 start_codon:yes stop_codon:yes gene_type:complete
MPKSQLSKYYELLLQYEKEERVALVDHWPVDLRNKIIDAISNAILISKLKERDCQLIKESTNQSIGNQIAKYTKNKLAKNINNNFYIKECKGPGYPDYTLIDISRKNRIPFEFKATTSSNLNDTNRIVLTSSSKKLRQQFKKPIYHLILTSKYKINSNNWIANIYEIRLDFLEPTTTVNIRLEGSVNKKILNEGSHHQSIL